MEQTKRQRQNSIQDDKNKDNLSKDSIKCFEDLSNEVIYEILDFLDFCQAYEAFSNLNIRFQNLLNYLTLPIKIHLSSLSESTFQRYYTQIITPNQHRIKSLYLSNSFIVDLAFSPTCNILTFTRVENLVFNNIKSECLENILIRLRSLPCLSALVIDCIDKVEKKDTIYRQIFQLHALKYCSLSLNSQYQSRSLPITATEFSPIEHLVIKNALDPPEINSLLSYVPQLRRLSICLSNLYPLVSRRPYTTQLHHLTHVSLTIRDVKLTDFEFLMKNMLYQVQVLHISVQSNSKYFDENRWKQLILSHLPNLRIFDVMMSYAFRVYENPDGFLSMIKQFNSSFWSERQWFFEHQIYIDFSNCAHLLFYSINPYRRKHYNLYDGMSGKTYSFDLERSMSSVRAIGIHNEKAMFNCKKYFPNANELTIFRTSNNEYKNSLLTGLNDIIPLHSITKLGLHFHCGSFSEIIELLHYLPNIHTFEILPLLIKNVDLMPIQNSEAFRLLSATNNIKELIILSKCTLKVTKFLINICPRLRSLTAEYSEDNFQALLETLLSKHNNNTHRLSSLSLKRFDDRFHKLDVLILSEKLRDVHIMKISRHLLQHDVLFTVVQ